MEILKSSAPISKRGSGPVRGSNFRSSAAFRRSKLDIHDTDADLRETYPDNLNFYTTPPSYSISLEEFEQYAVERLKMLRIIERINLTHESRHSMEYYEEIAKQVRKQQLPTYNILVGNNAQDYQYEDVLQARKIDHIAHFLLRLAFARTEDQRKWFISMEVDFFRLIMNREHTNFDTILKKHKLPFENAGEEAKTFHNEIINSTFTIDARFAAGNHIQVFKGHFTHALDLVRNRNVFLHDGYAYIPYSELATVISLKFRSYLSESLSLLKKNIHLVEDDERLRPLVCGFEKRHLGSSTSTTKSGDAVTVAQLETFSEKSFPLCMKHLYDVVQKEHHLKHWGRLQLGLFFKGLGVQIDEATKFWRNNFTKRPEIDSSRFDKQYLYNIRHMYGQEGKRADYTPYSCMKIIHSSVGPGDHHGCPFRHSDATPLRVKLVDAGIPQEGIKEIMNLVEQKHFQIACQRYFEYTHDQHSIDGGVNHPNQYFLESRNVLTGKKTIKIEGKTDAPRTLYYKNGDKSTQSQANDHSNSNMEVADVGALLNEDVDMTEDDGCDSMLSTMEY